MLNYPRVSPYLMYKYIGDDMYEVEETLLSVRCHLNDELVTFLKSLAGKYDPYDLLPGLLLCSKRGERKLGGTKGGRV